MKVTICELSEKEKALSKDWEELVIHTHNNQPDLVLLPELPFSTWIAANNEVNIKEKVESAKSHEQWLKRLPELSAELVVYSKPVLEEGKMYNTAFVWEKGVGHHKIHTKYYFPQEDGFWEESWYSRESKDFQLVEVKGVKIGVLLCSEIWFTENARKYGKEGIDVLLCPRATGVSSVSQWIRCGQTLAMISGAYCLSANKSGNGSNNIQWGGNGWIAEPMNGNLLGTTNEETKYITVNLDLGKSRQAKLEYPLYVTD